MCVWGGAVGESEQEGALSLRGLLIGYSHGSSGMIRNHRVGSRPMQK